MAGGLTIQPHKIPEFLLFLDNYFQDNPLPLETPSIVVDGAITFEHIRDPSFFHDLDLVGPFGVDFPTPRFVLSNIVLESIKVFGTNHLRMFGVQMNGQSHPLVFFRHADKPIGQWLLKQPSQKVNCVVTVQPDEYAGRRRALVMIEDVSL
jgi:single-stranded DNA-specific DHH superfamily exonuclease